MNTKGRIGEEIACQLLRKKGYQIIETNFSSKYGEIDIIATIDETLVFIEVKNYSPSNYLSPIESITQKKRRRIRRTIDVYRLKKNITDTNLRVDLVLIEGSQVDHIEGITL
ncbi:MAG: putative endonuclease [Candidatus Marinamargulisbacteria bacterium]